MTEFVHHHEHLNGLRYHFVTAGSGPAVLLLHGFPDLAVSWQPVMERLADAGYLAIAPDLRGFGESEAAAGVEQATGFDVLGDMVALLDHLGIPQAAVVGHDWGANVAWQLVQLRPDRFAAIAALSVFYQPRGELSLVDGLRRSAPPDLYFLYFLEEGLAEKELDADPDRFLRRLFFTNSGARPGDGPPAMRLAPTGLLSDGLDEPPSEDFAGFTKEHLDVLVASFRRTGFRGALNTYRSLHRSWELLAGWADRPPAVPSTFLVGDRDIIVQMAGGREAVEQASATLPGAESALVLDGRGHFIQVEAPDEVATRVLDFLGRHHPDHRPADQEDES